MRSADLIAQEKDEQGSWSLSRIEIPKVVDIIIAKQTQYYTLWGVYTAVQFAVANYGSSQTSASVIVFMLLGVWAFNLGHLGFVLRCSLQLNQFRIVLNRALDKDKLAYEEMLISALRDLDTKGMFWEFFRSDMRKIADPSANTGVHLLIDTCASVALVLRCFHGQSFGGD